MSQSEEFETINSVCKRLRAGRTWVYSRLKNDPSFPRPFYVSPREPRFLKSEIDSWISNQAAKRTLADLAKAA